jgi:3-hydroxyisobutyrate dehydrogenase
MKGKKVGLMGIGAMGKALADKMIAANVKLEIWNRSKDKTQEFHNKDVKIHQNPQDLITSTDVIILMLTDYFSINESLQKISSFENKTIIQMGTISPSESVLLYQEINEKGGVYFETTVLGSIPDIKNGALIMMIGGEEKNHSDWKWLLNIFGPKPLFVGPVGHAATVKLAMNQLIGSLTCAFSASLGLILNKNINLEVFMEIIRDSALYAPTFDKKLGKMLNCDFENGNFSTKHLLKDLNLFINESQSCGIDTTSVEGSRDISQLTVDNKKQDDDYSSVYSTINRGLCDK